MSGACFPRDASACSSCSCCCSSSSCRWEREQEPAADVVPASLVVVVVVVVVVVKRTNSPARMRKSESAASGLSVQASLLECRKQAWLQVLALQLLLLLLLIPGSEGTTFNWDPDSETDAAAAVSLDAWKPRREQVSDDDESAAGVATPVLGSRVVIASSVSSSSSSSSGSCVDIPSNLSLCQGIGYSKMRLPNLLHHESLAEVSQQAISWIPLFQLSCHPDTQLFLCSLFTPV